MSTIQDGGPAFPSTITDDSLHVGGMSLRDYFAAKAMQGMAAHPESDKWSADGIAKSAYQQADAMLAARKENEK